MPDEADPLPDSPISGHDIRPRSHLIAETLRTADDPAAELAQLYRRGPMLVSEFEMKAQQLRDLYQSERQEVNRKIRSAKRYKEAEEWTPNGAARQENANEAWEDANDNIENEIRPLIERLETRLSEILDELAEGYIAVAERRGAPDLRHPQRDKQEIQDRYAKRAESYP